MDDQATLSFVYPNVIQDLEIEESDQIPYAFSTTTIHGPSPTKQSHIVKNLIIKPLSGDEPIVLENAITQELPNMTREIPTPEEVSSIPGLSHLSSKFPKKRDWPTILLLGRDCIQALDQTQQIQSKDKHQRATKTPLGWAIIGKPAPSTRPLKNTASFKNKATSQKLPH